MGGIRLGFNDRSQSEILGDLSRTWMGGNGDDAAFKQLDFLEMHTAMVVGLGLATEADAGR